MPDVRVAVYIDATGRSAFTRWLEAPIDGVHDRRGPIDGVRLGSLHIGCGKKLRTAIIILGGFLLLSLCLVAGRWIGGTGTETTMTAAKVFIAIWLAAAAFNMWMGVAKAGYSVAEELPILLLIFALPAVAAAFVWWKFS
jgi:hypothetical protein